MSTSLLAAPRLGVGGAEFAKLWVAHSASNLSDGMRLAALPLLAAAVTRNPAAVGGLFAAQHVPSLLFGLPAGTLVDRVDRRRLLAGVHALRAAVVAALAVAVVTGFVSLPLLYVVALVLGSAEAVFDTAAQALVADVVDDTRLDRANGLLEVGMLAGNQFVGPALGGLLFAVVASGPFLADAGILLVAALAVATLRPATPPRTEPAAARASLRLQMAEGVRWLWRQRLLRTVTLFAGAINFLVNATLAIHVLFALEVLRLPASRYGVLLAAYAVGGVVGGMVAGPLIERFGRLTVIPPAIALAAAAMVATGLTSSPVVAGSMELLTAVGGTVWGVATVSLRQTLIPSHLFGRVAGVHRLVSLGGGAAGAAGGAIVASQLGLRAPFLAAGVLLAVLAVAARFVVRPAGSAAGALEPAGAR